MGIGKIDPEYAVREGWARDSDDEIYMDGYNAFIQIATRDGTSGFSVKNNIGAIAFSSMSDGDGYVAKDLDVGVKTTTLRLQVSEGAVVNHVLTSDGQGNATWQPIDASGLPPGTLDGYHPDITGQEHYKQLSEAIQTILKDLDGYGAGSLDEKVKISSSDTLASYLLDKIVAGHGISLSVDNAGGNEQLRILSDINLDGYASDQTVSEHYDQHSQAIQDVISSLDGYDTNLDGYLTDGYHRELDQLVHLISEDSFEEITYVSGNKVSSMIIWTDSGKTQKIREEQYTYDSWNRVTQILSIQYDPAGNENERMTETMTYDSAKVTSITRDVTIT